MTLHLSPPASPSARPHRSGATLGALASLLGAAIAAAAGCSGDPDLAGGRDAQGAPLLAPQTKGPPGQCFPWIPSGWTQCQAAVAGNPCAFCGTWEQGSSRCYAVYDRVEGTSCPSVPSTCHTFACDGAGACVDSGNADSSQDGDFCEPSPADWCNDWACQSGSCVKASCAHFFSGGPDTCCNAPLACNQMGGVHTCSSNCACNPE